MKGVQGVRPLPAGGVLRGVLKRMGADDPAAFGGWGADEQGAVQQGQGGEEQEAAAGHGPVWRSASFWTTVPARMKARPTRVEGRMASPTRKWMMKRDRKGAR